LIRDSLKNYEYFEKYLIENNNSINRFEIALNEKLLNDSNNLRGIMIFKLHLFSLYFCGFEASYSIGKNREELLPYYDNIIKYFVETWSKNDIIYDDVISLLSLGVLLNIDKIKMDKVISLIDEVEYYDFLITFLLNYLHPSEKRNTNTVNFKTHYPLKKFIELANNNKLEAINYLKLYLSKTWYKNMKDASWYDTHKSNNCIYTGYWSYESAAISKILLLNDIELKTQQYYPYDLVHFNN